LAGRCRRAAASGSVRCIWATTPPRGVGTGFNDRELARLGGILDTIPVTGPPPGLLYAGEPLDPAIRWLQPKRSRWSGSPPGADTGGCGIPYIWA
jgi:hypothetical protein